MLVDEPVKEDLSMILLGLCAAVKVLKPQKRGVNFSIFSIHPVNTEY